ncbi:MAG TPA: WXG100 family type VII secretion target [Micromonosporaceae bacterium]|nr:WXG100 family type VII secretion target [Micromonosporaceae bacterium]
MDHAQAHVAVLERTAGRFDGVNRSLEAMLRRLMAELDALEQQWRGAGGRTFDQVRRDWAADQARLHRALDETATAIRSSGRGYASSDADAASRARSVRRGLTLPL